MSTVARECCIVPTRVAVWVSVCLCVCMRQVYWSPEVSGSPGAACGVSSLTSDEYRTTVLQPYGRKVPIYLANNDYVMTQSRYLFGDWAEESLLQCERALYRLGVPKASWLDEKYYDEQVVALA